MNEIFLSILYTVASLIELIAAFYVLIADRRSPGNRTVALLFLVLAANSISYSSLIGAFSFDEALPWIALFVVSTYMIGPAVYLASVGVLRPRWLRHKWLYWPVYLVLSLPALLVLADLSGLATPFFSQPLIFIPPDPAVYAGGVITLGETAIGFLSRWMLLLQIGFPALAILCPLLVVAIKDWRSNPVLSRTAWILLAATLLASLSQTVIAEEVTLLVSTVFANFAFILAFVLISLGRSQIPWSLSVLRRSLNDWPIFAKLVLVVVTVFVPAVVVITLVSGSIVRANITGQIGSSLNTLARLQARNLAEALRVETSNLERLGLSPVLLSTLNLRLQETRAMEAAEIRAWLNQEEAAWVSSEATMVEQIPESFLSSVSVLNEFRETFPVFTYLQLTDRNGGLISATATPRHFDFSNAGWWRTAAGQPSGGVFISVPLRDPATGGRYLQIALPIIANDGSPAGVLLGHYDMSAVLANFASTRVGERGRSDLFSPGGILVPLSSGAAVSGDIRLDWDDLLTGETYWRILPYGGVSSILSWATVAEEAPAGSPGSLQWRITVHQPTTEALQSILAAQQASTITTLITTALGFGFTWLLASFITQPLSSLTSVAQKVLDGNFDVRADVQGRDEIGVLAYTFNTMTAQVSDLVANLEREVAMRTADLVGQTEKLQAAAHVGQGVSSILDADELMQTTVVAIQERFDLYYVGLFLVDESREWAVLQSGTGEAGERMLARRHRIRVGEGMVGWSVQNGRVRVTGEAAEDAVRLATGELPYTRSEAAIPLRVRGQTIGALSVQSERAGEFDPATVNILQTLADQVGIAIDNANLLEQNRAALAESQQALETVRRTYQQVTAAAWTETSQRQQWALVATQEGVRWKPAAVGMEAAGIGEPVSGHTAANEISVPIRVREHTVGTIRLKRPQEAGGWSEAESRYIEAYVSQLGLALDSARLFQDIQNRSVQLQASAEIGRAATSILRLEELLPAAVGLIGERFNLYYAGVFLLDENKEWAVLLAGTGEAGRIQLEANHRLAVGGQSMIGQAIASGEARIAMDVGAEAIRFDNPLLPDTRTEMALPLQTGGETIGALTIQSTRPAAFTGEDIAVFQTMANQLATAIQNARLFEQTQAANFTAQEQRRIADALLRSSARFAETQEQDRILQIIVEEIDEQIRPDQINILLLDELTDTFLVARKYSPGDSEDAYTEGQLVPVSERPDLVRIYERLDHVYLPEMRADGLMHEQYRLPLLQANTAIGVVETFHTARDAHIRIEDRAVIDGIVQQAAVALQSAEAFRQTGEALSRTEALYEVGQAAITAESRTALLESAARISNRALGTDRVVFRRIDPDVQQILEAVGAGPGIRHSPLDLPFAELMDGLHGWVLRERRPARSSRSTPDPRDSENTRRLRAMANCGAILIVPIMAREELIGMITAINTPEAPDFTELDEELLVAVANQTAVALQNLELFAETQKTAQNERLLNQIGSQLIQSLDFETILRTAVAEIGQLPNIANVTLTVGDAGTSNGDANADPSPDRE